MPLWTPLLSISAAPELLGVLGEDGVELLRPPVVSLLLDRPGVVEELLDPGEVQHLPRREHVEADAGRDQMLDHPGAAEDPGGYAADPDGLSEVLLVEEVEHHLQLPGAAVVVLRRDDDDPVGPEDPPLQPSRRLRGFGVIRRREPIVADVDDLALKAELRSLRQHEPRDLLGLAPHSGGPEDDGDVHDNLFLGHDMNILVYRLDPEGLPQQSAARQTRKGGSQNDGKNSRKGGAHKPRWTHKKSGLLPGRRGDRPGEDDLRRRSGRRRRIGEYSRRGRHRPPDRTGLEKHPDGARGRRRGPRGRRQVERLRGRRPAPPGGLRGVREGVGPPAQPAGDHRRLRQRARPPGVSGGDRRGSRGGGLKRTVLDT